MKHPLSGYLMPFDMLVSAYRYVLLLIFMVALASCAKEESTGQSPSFELVTDSGYVSGPVIISPGQQMNFKVVAKEGSEKLTNFFIEVEDINHTKTRYFDTAIYNAEFKWEGSFYKSSEQHELWRFIIRDRKGKGAGEVFFIGADTNATFTPVVGFNNILLGAQNNILTGGFFALSNQTVYSALAAMDHQELIDMMFYFGEDQSTLASPGANIEDNIYPEAVSPLNWEVRNTTRYIKTGLTESDFDGADNDSIMIETYIEDQGKKKAKNLQTGDIYVFSNQNNLLGLFKVNEVTGSDTGIITIDIKIQDLTK